jgi:uncharacterized membrane protein YphA (DoxX/SURF4 family)
MISAVITFAVLTAILELFILLKFSSAEWLTSSWTFKRPRRNPNSFMGWEFVDVSVRKDSVVHVVAMVANLVIHFGTIVGTMTAIVAGVVSFITVPMAVWLLTHKTFFSNLKKEWTR